MKLGTRAVAMGSTERHDCHGCGQTLQPRLIGVCANVYHRGKWIRLEWWHRNCYTAAGEPDGPILPYTQKASNAASVLTTRTCIDCNEDFLGTRWHRRCSVCAKSPAPRMTHRKRATA